MRGPTAPGEVETLGFAVAAWIEDNLVEFAGHDAHGRVVTRPYQLTPVQLSELLALCELPA